MKYANKQSGFALLAILALLSITLLFSVSGQLSSVLNKLNVTQFVDNQTLLLQAKKALIGYAADYDFSYPGQFPGYLPCPDTNGNGSANPPCGNQSESAIGCLPWRTLGLPEMKDQGVSPLLYAVSGSYKNSPKQALSNHSNGLFVIEDAYGQAQDNTDSANQRAIAVIFSPGTALSGQNRSNPPNCGNPSAYLETLNGVDNATGLKSGASGSVPGISALPNSNGSVFVQAVPTWNNNQSQLIFNDQLLWITPEDYAPVYEKMAIWVIDTINTCLSNYSQQVISNINAANAAAQTAWENEQGVWDQDTLTAECLAHVQATENGNKTGWCNTNKDYYQAWLVNWLEENPSPPSTPQPTPISTNINHYPWLAPFDSSQVPLYNDGVNLRFGRIPSVLDDSQSSNALMPTSWTANPSAASACFNASASGLDNGEWGWWDAWREVTFLAIHENNTPISTTAFDASIIPPPAPSGVPVELSLESNDNVMEWVLTITGRETDDQQRETAADQANWRNYFHCNNNQSAGSYIIRTQAAICAIAAQPGASSDDIDYCNNYTEYFKLPEESGQAACRTGGDVVCGRCQGSATIICDDQDCP